MMGQELSMMSLGAGPVSFTHIVKALEPFFSAVVSAVVFGKWMHPMVYATLIPVVGGVAYACLKERSFSWLAFWTAMGCGVQVRIGFGGRRARGEFDFGQFVWGRDYVCFFAEYPAVFVG
jgi:solute carrier family 35 protein E1